MYGRLAPVSIPLMTTEWVKDLTGEVAADSNGAAFSAAPSRPAFLRPGPGPQLA